MKHAGTILAILTIALSGLFLRANDSATRPATQPSASAKKKPAPKDWLAIESPKQYRFWVPRTWSRQGAIFIFPQTAEGSVPQFQVAVTACHAVTCEADAADLRETMPKLNPGLKIVEDKATQLGGRPAWQFVYDKPWSAEAATPQGKQTYHFTTRWLEILTEWNHQRLVIFYLDDARSYNRGMPFVQRAIDSFEWLDAPPATQPSAGK